MSNIGREMRAIVADLPAASFAMVMATGIVSTAAFLRGMEWLALALFYINVGTYVVIWILSAARTILYPRLVIEDLSSHPRAFCFFTAPAATCVLGSEIVLLFKDQSIAAMLWVFGLVLWAGVMYVVFTALMVKEDKPTIADGINGAWLLAVVATQSVALLGAQLSTSFGPHKLVMNFFALSMWVWGGIMLYNWMMPLISYRYVFFRFSPGDLTPPFWINMGAMAISTLTGTVLFANTSHAPFLLSLLPFLKGLTVTYWATATWWIPTILNLAIWRHVYKRFPLRYDTLYWGGVFPLGMYVVCTIALSRAMDLPFLEPVAHYFFFVALIAWLATFVGLLRSVARHAVRAIG